MYHRFNARIDFRTGESYTINSEGAEVYMHRAGHGERYFFGAHSHQRPTWQDELLLVRTQCEKKLLSTGQPLRWEL
jgi:hypothetical protein